MNSTASTRLKILESNLVSATTNAIEATPHIVATPRTSLLDEKVSIQIQGLGPNQIVRLVMHMVENKVKFESSGVFRANATGDIDLDLDASLAGTYTGIDPMGLFWSLAANSGQGEGVRLVKKNVSVPLLYTIQVLRETSEYLPLRDVLAETTVEKLYMKKGVRRVTVNEGPLRGTVFIPEGQGPFPAMLDLFGGLVSLVETRAALLASHGFVAFALVYLYQGNLPQKLYDFNIGYIKNATEWLSRQSYVDKNRIGAIGLCFGGNICLRLAAINPLIKAVVNINGTSVTPDNTLETHTSLPWPKSNKIYRTKDGIMLHNIWECDTPHAIPAWQHGAKVLFIVGKDDAQVHPSMHHYCKENWPEEYRQNFEMHTYQGTGHLIEPPYSPHCRVARATKQRMASVNFIPEEYHDSLIVAGGNPKEHGYAQIDAWKRIIDFLQRTLDN